MVGSWLCDWCRSRIRRLEEPRCRRREAVVGSARPERRRRGRLKSLARVRSAASYEGPLELALQRFKYQGWRRLAEPLAQLVAERLVVEGLAAPWVVAVPLHTARLRQRGYNQSELLASELRRRLYLSKPTGELVRTPPTPPQVGHDRRWRLDNVGGAFERRGGRLEARPIFLPDALATPLTTPPNRPVSISSGMPCPLIAASMLGL